MCFDKVVGTEENGLTDTADSGLNLEQASLDYDYELELKPDCSRVYNNSIVVYMT